MDAAKLSIARVRPARSEEDLARAEAFMRTPRVREVVEGHPEERGCVRLCEANGELLGALLIDPTPLRIRDVDLRCARLCETAGEDGRLQFRRTGERDLFEFMVEEFLGYVWARRYPVAYVHGELALYPDHGFVPSFYHPRAYVDTAAALRLPAPYRVRLLKSDDVRKIDELRRRDRRWKPAAFASGVPLFHHFCIEDGNRGIRGCFSLEVNREARWNPRFFAPEADVVDEAAASTLLRYCAEKAQESDIKQMHFPVGPGHPLARLCLGLGGHTAMRGAATDPRLNEEMICILDPVRFGHAIADSFARRLIRAGATQARGSIGVATERGAWSIEIAGGKAEIVALHGTADGCVELPHWQLTQFLAGYLGVDDLELDFSAEQRALLRILLPKSWPYSMPDADHWSTKMPPLPYTRRALEVVERVRLPWATSDE